MAKLQGTKGFNYKRLAQEMSQDVPEDPPSQEYSGPRELTIPISTWAAQKGNLSDTLVFFDAFVDALINAFSYYGLAESELSIQANSTGGILVNWTTGPSPDQIMDYINNNNMIP